MVYYIILFAINIYLFFLQHLWLILLVILLSFIILILLLNKNQNHFNNLTYQDMKITNWTLFGLTAIIFLITYLGFFSYRRFYNIGKNLDLKLFIYNISLFIKQNDIIIILLTIFFIISILLLYLSSFKLIKNFVFYQSLKLHIIIMSKAIFKENSILEINWYDKIIHKIIKIEYYIPNKLFKLFIFLNYKKEYGDYSAFDDKLTKQYNFYTHRNRFNLYLIFIFILYDIIFNNLVINKIYYILPVIFIFFLIKKIISVMCFFEKADCIQLYSIFYKKVKVKEKFLIIFENGVTVESHEINKRLGTMFEPRKPQVYYLGYTEILKEGVFFLIFNIFLYLYALKNSNITMELLLYNELFVINLNIVLTIILLIQIFVWLLINNNRFFKYSFWLITMVIILLLSLIFIKHNVPLLFDEINSYANITIKDTYTVQEKLYFITEYLKYKSNHLNNKDQEYLLQILEKIPLTEYIYNTSFDTLRTYVDNLLLLHNKVEINISLIIDNYLQDIIDDIRKNTYNNIDYYFFVVNNIKTIFNLSRFFKRYK